MAISSKNITTNDLQLYLEDDISYDKKKYILEIENKNVNGEKLTNDEAKTLKELNILRDVDIFFESTINNQPSMPQTLQNEIDQTLNFISNKKPSLIESFLNIKHLISSSIGAIVAITAMMFFTVSTTNLAFKSGNSVTSWIIKNDIGFAISHFSSREIDVTEDVKVKINDEIVFTLLPSKSKIIDINYLSNDGNNIELYKNLSVEKGKKFITKKLTIVDPIGTDKIQILENGKIILEKNIIVSE